jgi:FixJ family two-component response regulator
MLNEKEHLVCLVDDDSRVREAVSEMLASAGVRVMTFGSFTEFTQFAPPDVPACLVLDVELPDGNGLEFQRQIERTDHLPIIFITGHGDIASSVRAIKGGAVDFLAKPFSDADLLQAIDAALAQHRAARLRRAEMSQIRARYSSLTAREREVLPLVVSGLLNKQAAAELGISEVTLQIHRSKVMRKMAAKSVAELVRLATKLEISLPTPKAGR